MKKQDKLYDLIQSMTMSEKRYFKLFAKRHTIGEKNDYIHLFEILEQMPEYDLPILINGLTKLNLSTRHLASDKNFLYQQILRSLSSYYDSKTVSLHVKEALHQVEILYTRGLYSQCLTLMHKAKQKALKYDLYPLLIEISLWERKAMGKMGDIEGVKMALDESMQHMALLDNMHAFMKLYYQIIELRRSISKARSSEAVSRLNEFMTHPFLQSEDIPLSFQARLHYWRIYAMYYYSIDDAENELMANEHLLELMNANENYAQEYPMEFVAIYSRILTLRLHASEAEFLQVLRYFRSFPDRLKKLRRSVETQVELDSHSIELAWLLERGKVDAALELTEHMRELSQKHRRRMTAAQKMTYCYMFVYTFLANENYPEALKEINILLNEFDDRVRQELFIYARLLNMIIHAELGNLTVLKYEADSTHRYLKKRKKLHAVELTLIRFFRRFSRLTSNRVQARLKLYEQLKTELGTVLKDQYERKTLAYFDFLTWINSRILGVSFSEAKQLSSRSTEA